MRIGVLDLLRGEGAGTWKQRAYAHIITKQYASIMPQAISYWCRQLGHQVFYATYFGQEDPKRLLPDDLDVVFISAYTRASALAYALAKLYRREGAVTIIGGPHAKAFPDDCLRFFDIVVGGCDQQLIVEILRDLPRGVMVSSDRILRDLPSVEERLPEVRASAFWRGRPWIGANIPLLASVGCPYQCNFCTDWDNPYAVLPLDRLEADLQFISRHYPGVMISFHDPNFAVRFDEMLDVLERVPPGRRNRYFIESSLSILRGSRLERLRETRCLFVAPGVESWSGYSNKSGVRVSAGAEQKLAEVVAHFRLLRQYVPGIQANFMFGLDLDQGDEPVALTKRFMSQAPFVWPTVNIPTPFGGTPLYDEYLDQGRILTAMPFLFYYAPYLVTTLKHYEAPEYYANLCDLFSHMTSPGLVIQRLRTTPGLLRPVWAVRTAGARGMRGELRRLHRVISQDREVRAFHEGQSATLPEFYHREFDRFLGPYAALLSRDERTPLHRPRPKADLRSAEERIAATAGRLEIIPLVQQQTGV